MNCQKRYGISSFILDEKNHWSIMISFIGLTSIFCSYNILSLLLLSIQRQGLMVAKLYTQGLSSALIAN